MARNFGVKRYIAAIKLISDLLCTSQMPSLSMLKPLIFNIQENLARFSGNDSSIVKSLKEYTNIKI